MKVDGFSWKDADFNNNQLWSFRGMAFLPKQGGYVDVEEKIGVSLYSLDEYLRGCILFQKGNWHWKSNFHYERVLAGGAILYPREMFNQTVMMATLEITQKFCDQSPPEIPGFGVGLQIVFWPSRF